MDPVHRVDSKPSFRRPTILIGADASPLGRPVITPPQAAGAGLYGIDLDLRTSWRSPSVDDIRDTSTARIRSVWLPAQYTGLFSEQRASRLQDFLMFAAARCGLRTVVMPKSTTNRSQGVPLGTIARQLADSHNVRIAVQIAADSVLRERASHLDHVANMRRVAEEWNLDIALDLTAPGLGRWEAEAALMRLFPRLSLVRIHPWLEADGQHSLTESARAALRSVNMLADQAYVGLISIAPVTMQPAWLASLFPPGLNPASATRKEILATYDRIDQSDPLSRHARNRRIS